MVVDDGSTDQSLGILRSRFPQIEVVSQPENKGFSETVATGVKMAKDEIVILLNTDVRPEPDFIQYLVHWFKRPDIFSVSPLIVDAADRPSKVSWNRSYFRFGRLKTYAWDLDQILRDPQPNGFESLFASGGSIALRKSMFLQLGGFLSLYKPFYFEDKDLGTRAWRRGWRTVFEPRSKVIHKHRSTIGRLFSNDYVSTIGKRNSLLYLCCHASWPRLLILTLPRGIRLAFIDAARGDTTQVRALFLAMRLFPQVLAARSKLRSQNGIYRFSEILKRMH